jgi:ABC-type transporter MlaC component
MSMGRILSQGLFGAALATLLLLPPEAAPSAQNLASGLNPLTPSQPTAAKPAPAATTPAKPAAKAADRHSAPAHPTKVAAKPKPPAKKIAAAKKPAPKLTAKKPEPPKQAATAPATTAQPSYKITTIRDHVAYQTTRIVPVSPPAAPAERLAAVPPQPATPPAEHKAATPPVQAAASPPPQSPAPPSSAAAPPAQAAATTPAASFVGAFLGKAFGIARDANMTPLQRRALLADLFANRMDVTRIAGYTTGDELTGQPVDFQHRFKTILISYLVETYYPRIELAADPSVKLEVSAATSLPDGTAVVWTTFTKSDWMSQAVKWHLVPEDDGFKIVDIYSAGASLVQMERDTFRSVMRDGGLPQLMAKLDARTKLLSNAAP